MSPSRRQAVNFFKCSYIDFGTVKIRKSKIALKETPTPKLELTPVMTVTQVCVFVKLRRETTLPP